MSLALLLRPCHHKFYIWHHGYMWWIIYVPDNYIFVQYYSRIHPISSKIFTVSWLTTDSGRAFYMSLTRHRNKYFVLLSFDCGLNNLIKCPIITLHWLSTNLHCIPYHTSHWLFYVSIRSLDLLHESEGRFMARSFSSYVRFFILGKSLVALCCTFSTASTPFTW